MKRTVAVVALPLALAMGTLGVSGLGSSLPAGATTQRAIAPLAAKSWHGKISSVKVRTSTHGIFQIHSGTKSYNVVYNHMTHFNMGKAANIKVGAYATVTGTLTKSTIFASLIDV